MLARFLPVALVLASTSSFAASFDCKLAKTPREHTICSSPGLSAKDSLVAAAYTRLRSGLTPDSAAAVQQDQRAWLLYLDHACSSKAKADRANTAGCLEEEYATRLAQLKQAARLTDGHTMFTRAAFLTMPNTKDAVQDPQFNPGFGVGRFAWPQIDNPTPQEQAFNQSARTFAIALNPAPQKHLTTLVQATDGDAQTDVSWSLGAQNSRLLSVHFENFLMGYGAAHPSTTDATLNFWLDTGKPLAAGDVFQSTTNWKAALIPLIAARLKADKDLQPYLWKTGPELNKGIAAGLADPGEWTLSSRGYAIVFGQYQVAAYVAGMPAVDFTWKELHAWLNPALNPSTLPAEKPAGKEN